LKDVDVAGARELWSQAGEKYRAALAIKPDKHDALFNWGNALDDEAQALKDADLAGARELWSQAGEKYRAALAIKPDKHEVLDNMAALCGSLYRESVDPLERSVLLKEMRSYAQQAGKVVPGEGAYNLACSYALENDVGECLRWLDVSRERGRLPDAEHLQKDPDLSNVRDHEAFTAWWAKHFPDVSGDPSKAPVG
jgi:tetratricopeptide (TPR) repeat protein